MRARRLFPLLLLLATLALAACGDDSDSGGGTEESAVPPAETTTEAAESGEATAEDDEAAPSGDAVRAAKVEIDGFAYEPATVTVEAGGKVTWINRDAEGHTATLDDGSFDSGDIAEGKLASQAFKQPGSFAYHCEIHPEMTGTVEVVEPG
ncbi:MAG TPA: cupredoxin family copper-binding protein [Solirubrobacterales bacterium]|nr:cupredoxin family copper-binding protein [Solirubrobacterales bacterium]